MEDRMKPFPARSQASSRSGGEGKSVGAEVGNAPVRREFRGHLPALDGMRGIAVLLVMLYHFASPYASRSIGTTFSGFVSQLVNVGWCGVDVFFVLSGFLITGILCDAKGIPHYFRRFWMRRVLRIFPLYYAFLLVLFVFVPLVRPFPAFIRQHLAEEVWFWGYGMNLDLSMASHPLIDALHLQHFWSLAVEEQFYLLWPFVIFLSQPKTAIRISMVCIVSALFFRLLLTVHHSHPLIIWNLTLCRTDGLAIGALCALAVRSNCNRRGLVRAARFVAVLSAVALVALLYWRRTWSWDDAAMETLGISLFGLFSGGILLLSLDPSKSCGTSWLLSCPLLMTLGFYSYGIYVFHFPLIIVFNKWFPVWNLMVLLHSYKLAVGIYVLGATLGSLVVAVLSWHLYERHFLKLKKHFELRTGADVATTPFTKEVRIGRSYNQSFAGWTQDLIVWIHSCPLLIPKSA
jgi:peptidoglycan/LPS O-acetylase OafA/YrhL